MQIELLLEHRLENSPTINTLFSKLIQKRQKCIKNVKNAQSSSSSELNFEQSKCYNDYNEYMQYLKEYKKVFIDRGEQICLAQLQGNLKEQQEIRKKCVMFYVKSFPVFQQNLQFLIDDESLDTLLFHYLLNSKLKEKTLIVNSVLMKLIENNQQIGLFEVFKKAKGIVEENCLSENGRSVIEKETYRNMAVLLREIINKYPKIVQKLNEQQSSQIMSFCHSQSLCAVSGNQYITLMSLLFFKIHATQKIIQIVTNTILQPKMNVASYRQIVRLHLYMIFLKIVQNKTDLTQQFVQKVIQVVQQQKDPRNISYVFEIYLHILNNTKTQNLKPIANKIFDNLQMYYPIDFEGDTQKYHINLRNISFLLDQCLTHPLFQNELRTLLMVKMGAVPISKYISTFISSQKQTKSEETSSFWVSLLIRTTEQEYLQEEHPEDSEHTLSNLITELLNRLVPKSSPIPYKIINVLERFFDNLVVKQIFNKQQNSKNAGIVIYILKDIIKKCNKNTINFASSFTIHHFLKTAKQQIGEMVYKLGILVPILQNKQFVSNSSEDISVLSSVTQLLIMTLSHIYSKNKQQNTVRLIVLKLYMLLSVSQINLKMISQTNILIECLNVLQNDNVQNTDVKVLKAYTDFIVQVYHNKKQVLLAIKNHNKVEIKIYGLITIVNKEQNLKNNLTEILQQQINQQVNYKQFLNVIKMLKAQAILKCLTYLNSSAPQKYVQQFCKVVQSKCTNLQLSAQNIGQFIQKYLTNEVMLYICKFMWRSFLLDIEVRKKIKSIIEQSLKTNLNTYLARVTAFFNKSLKTFNIQNQKIQNQIQNTKQYRQQLAKMMPIDPKHEYTGEQCKYWPTLIEYVWKNRNKNDDVKSSDLMQWLPTSILVKEAHEILPIIVKNQDVETASKILKNLPSEKICEQIIPFTINFLQNFRDNTDVQKIVAMNKILFDLQQMSKEDANIHQRIIKLKQKILICIQEKLLQHRKRRARQSSRALFSLFNSLK